MVAHTCRLTDTETVTKNSGKAGKSTCFDQVVIFSAV